MKIKLVIMSLILFTLTGCIEAPQVVGWHKIGVSQQDTETRLAQCRYEIGIQKISLVKQENLIQDCMKGQGFRWY